MKLMNFINKFVKEPFGCSISAMPARIADNLTRRKSASVKKMKKLEIKLPRTIYPCDVEFFPTFEDIKQYYTRFNNWEYVRKPDAPKILVPFEFEYDEYKPAYIERAIERTLIDMDEQAEATCNRLDNDIYHRKQVLKKHQQCLEQGQKWEALQKQVDDALGFHVRIAPDWQIVDRDYFRFYNVERLEKWIQSQNRAITACQERKKKIEANKEELRQLLDQF